jgi:hypothetical protein
MGLVRGLRELNSAAEQPDLSVVNARIDSLSLLVARLGDQSQQLSARQEAYVTRIELAEALDGVFGKLTNNVDTRFERQTRSVEALQLMIGQTDELLQKVLDSLETMRNQAIENDRNLAQTQP